MARKDLARILENELHMNVDFAARLRDNLSAGVPRLPRSLMHHISHKYGIGMAELDSINDQLLTHAARCVGHQAPRPPRRKLVVHTKTKKTAHAQ